MGSRVADTIRTHIIEEDLFELNPQVLLLGMMCAIVGSSVFLTMATRYGFPVSTTHSIIGGFVGAGIASVGVRRIKWGWNGVSQVFAAWVIAPGLAGLIGAILFLITKYIVLTRSEAPVRAFWSIPLYTFCTVASLTMLVVWKGIQLNNELTTTQIMACVFSIATGIVIIQSLFTLPYLWCRVMREDWQLQWYHIFYGPFLLRRPRAPPPPPGIQRLNIRDYYSGYLSLDEIDCIRRSEQLMQSVEHSRNVAELMQDGSNTATNSINNNNNHLNNSNIEAFNSSSMGTSLTFNSPKDKLVEGVPPRPMGPWNSLPVFIWRLNRVLLRGLEKDVINFQRYPFISSSSSSATPHSVLSLGIEDIHARCLRFDNRAEHMYSALQILTAATSSFIHGANDVANSVAPFISAYHLWLHGAVVGHEVPVPLWVLCFGGGAIVLGLLTYGYHVIRNMGNRMTLISPSRGFCMELGSALTVLIATRHKLPVSTTQCIAGAVVGVGLANGDWRAVNRRLIVWVYLGWMVTVPATAFLSGALMAFVLNAPRFSGFEP